MRKFKLDAAQAITLYALATFCFVVIIAIAIIMAWRVGSGPGILPLSSSFAMGTILILFVIGLGSLFFLEKPSILFLAALAFGGSYGLYKGLWRYLWYDAVEDFNPEFVIGPGTNELIVSAFSCIVIVGAAVYYMRKLLLETGIRRKTITPDEVR